MELYLTDSDGYQGEATGEVCFNTAMTGYQEIMTDPSYTSQIITFTFPHIEIINSQDIESNQNSKISGVIFRRDIFTKYVIGVRKVI